VVANGEEQGYDVAEDIVGEVAHAVYSSSIFNVPE
jgi:hypothetical protein